MLKGLALRQGLVAINGAMIIALVLIVMLAGRDLLSPKTNVGPVSAPDLGKVSDPLDRGPKQPRSVYDKLGLNGLFGAAGSYKGGAQPTETPAAHVESTADAVETKLPLKLFGTVFSTGERPRYAAIIESSDGAVRTQTYYLDDKIIDDVFLKKVRESEVIILNRKMTPEQEESLKISWKAPTVPLPKTAAGVPARTAAAPGAPNVVTLDRDAISKQLQDEYAKVASTMNVRVVKDAQGKVQGITTDNIEQYDVAKQLGLSNGDVLATMNNEQVDSKESAVEILRRYANASIFRLGVIRGGQTQYITYRVR